MFSTAKRWAIGFGMMVLLFGAIVPVHSIAEYSDSCSMYAQQLGSAADDYESRKRQFKSACDPYYGYNKNDEAACGSYGYARSSYDRAKTALRDAISSVASFCGVPEESSRHFLDLRKMGNELNELKKKLADKEAELEAFKSQKIEKP